MENIHDVLLQLKKEASTKELRQTLSILRKNLSKEIRKKILKHSYFFLLLLDHEDRGVRDDTRYILTETIEQAFFEVEEEGKYSL